MRPNQRGRRPLLIQTEPKNSVEKMASTSCLSVCSDLKGNVRLFCLYLFFYCTGHWVQPCDADEDMRLWDDWLYGSPVKPNFIFHDSKSIFTFMSCAVNIFKPIVV